MQKPKKPVIAYLHTHWDPEWYRTLEAFNVRLIEVFDNVLEGLKSGNIPSFYFDGQVYALLNYLNFRPSRKNLVKKLIKEKRLFIGPFYVSADSLLPSGMSLVKNLEFGLKISKDFGQKNFIGYLSDTFGHSKSIFEILKLFSLKNAIVWRGAGNIPSDFIANGIKTTRLVYGYYQDILHSELSFDKKAESIEKTLDKINEFSGEVLLLPLGGDHLAPPKDAAFQIEEINKRLEKYEIKLSNPFEYLKKADFSKMSFEGELLDNSQTYILQGVYSSRADEKKNHAKLEWELFNKAQVFDYFMKNKYESELDFATVELIKNIAHDSIYGCSTDSVHKAVRARQSSVFELTKAVEDKLIRDFKNKNLISDNENKIGVFNFSSFPQEGVLRVISDKKIKNAQKIKTFKTVSDEIMQNICKNPMTEDFHDFYEYLIELPSIKPFSFKNIEIKKPEKAHAVGTDFIENKELKLFVMEGKIYALNKKKGKMFSDFIQLLSTPDNGDSYNYAPCGYPSALKLISSKIKTNGKIQSTLELKFEENIKLNVSLNNSSKYFEIEADFINKKKNRKLQVAINTELPVNKTLAEDSIGTIERSHDPEYLLFENMPTQDKSELKTNAYPMQRFVCANNVGLVALGLKEYEVYKNQIKITLLRSTGVISNPKNLARKIPAGPPIECPELQALGAHKMRFAITFEENMHEIADSFMGPYIGILGEFKIKNKTYLNSPSNLNFYGISKIEGERKPLFI